MWEQQMRDWEQTSVSLISDSLAAPPARENFRSNLDEGGSSVPRSSLLPLRSVSAEGRIRRGE